MGLEYLHYKSDACRNAVRRKIAAPPTRSPHLRDCSIVRPDIIVERVCGLHIFSSETDRGRQWLESRAVTAKHQRLGKSLGVDDEGDARDLVDAAAADGLDVME